MNTIRLSLLLLLSSCSTTPAPPMLRSAFLLCIPHERQQKVKKTTSLSLLMPLAFQGPPSLVTISLLLRIPSSLLFHHSITPPPPFTSPTRQLEGLIKTTPVYPKIKKRARSPPSMYVIMIPSPLSSHSSLHTHIHTNPLTHLSIRTYQSQLV
ncbi:hypothetical protein BDB00DRAFT_516065 [Zychaea mexicana]|uniref:uncharacterized protein n=1 Tax=Zychaea mexicana TaxID=64656 RepID=UPI0022FEC6D2|nr:uncharacterized protein BDB00DRAFT_516065 [Zychaea mexicana]KAI9491152.1 hypothetical protein BDB00DRAFT_516065 [Zychaea mexicana]